DRGPWRTLIVVACHDRLWWSLPKSLTARMSTVVFDGLSDDDAGALARSWELLGVEVSRASARGPRRLSADEVKVELVANSKTLRGSSVSTLSCAIVAVQRECAMVRRVVELMDRLSRTVSRPISDSTLAYIYGAI